MIRKAEKRDIKGLLKLLYQVDAVHSGIRPDLFKSNTPKYDEQALEHILEDDDKPIFVYDDGEVLGHAFCQITEVRNHRLLQDIKTLYIDDICVMRSYGASTSDKHYTSMSGTTPSLSAAITSPSTSGRVMTPHTVFTRVWG